MTHNGDCIGDDDDSWITKAQWLHVQRKLRLTPRQMQIVKLVFGRCRSDEIARRLELKASNVDKHFRRLYLRTGARDRTDLMLRIFKIVLLEGPR